MRPVRNVLRKARRINHNCTAVPVPPGPPPSETHEERIIGPLKIRSRTSLNMKESERYSLCPLALGDRILFEALPQHTFPPLRKLDLAAEKHSAMTQHLSTSGDGLVESIRFCDALHTSR